MVSLRLEGNLVNITGGVLVLVSLLECVIEMQFLMGSMTEVDSCYAVPNISARGYQCKTNLPPNTVMRGAGRPQAAFFAHHYIQAVADYLNVPAAQVNKRLRTCYSIHCYCFLTLGKYILNGVENCELSTDKLSTVGDRAFSATARRVWNTLPDDIFSGTPVDIKIIFAVEASLKSSDWIQLDCESAIMPVYVE